MTEAATHMLEMLDAQGLFCGQSPTMRAVDALIADVAQTQIPVLLFGESGTGKDIYARLIHRQSEKNNLPLRKLSCTLIDAQSLLQHLRLCCGSHTTNVPGTLFVDGVDELDIVSQRALLSLLPDGDPASDDKIYSRLICTASRNLEHEVAAGRFRSELYFRISGFCIRLPALRERKEDIPGLLRFLLAKHSIEPNCPVITDQAMEVLIRYAWPGNIRELENLAKKIVALGDVDKVLSDLRLDVEVPRERSEAPLSSFKRAARAASRRTERDLILKALNQTNWNRKRAAQELKISYKSLLYKIKQIGVQESGLE
jgi:two-component system response regulator AtoC